MRTLFVSLFLFFSTTSFSQNLDSLKREVLALHQETRDINLRINNSDQQFRTGILVSTIGYSVTIAGGLMLGRSNDQLGQALLITGGLTGATGTYIMVDAFRVLSGKRRKKNDPRRTNN